VPNVLGSAHLAKLILSDLHDFREDRFVKVIVSCGRSHIALVQLLLFIHEEGTAVIILLHELHLAILLGFVRNDLVP
jgi:hypothetical protein